VNRFRGPNASAIALTGSRARNDHGNFSDLDLVRFLNTDHPQPARTFLIDGLFVVVSNVTPTETRQLFLHPEKATRYVAGLRTALPLWDPNRTLHRLIRRARAFTWTQAMQQKANAWASRELVGWIEEAQKGLEGLLRNDEGRLLNARHGLSWGLLGVMRVQQGILITSENTTHSQVFARLGKNSPWTRLARQAFGIEPIPLRHQVIAGLRLYILTATRLRPTLQRADRPLIEEAVKRIRAVLKTVKR
jgi:hypothetical protein